MDLTGKTIIITGASRGIGRAIAIALSKYGANIVAVYNSHHDDAVTLAFEIPKNLLIVKADVTIEDDVKNIFDQVHECFGSVDILINNAGINIVKPISELTYEEWNKVISIDLNSVFLVSKYALSDLENTKGLIINIASRHGYPDMVNKYFTAYGAAKAGVINFTVCLSKELKEKDIRVNAIIPAPTDTDLLNKAFSKDTINHYEEIGELGKPEEVADIVFQIIDDGDSTGEIYADDRIYN